MEDVTLLLVEDDDSDVMLFQRTCGKHDLGISVEIAKDGAHALAMLRGDTDETPISMPSIMVTDINMPGMSGHELIRSIRADQHFSDIVIYVWSTSNLERDIKEAYAEKIAGYILKDDDGVRLNAAVQMFKNKCEAVTFPSCR